MSIINYNNTIFTIKDNKFNLKEIFEFLNYNNILENDLYIEKDKIHEFLDINKHDDKKFLEFINNNYLEPFYDIYTYMEKNNINIFTNNIFKELWQNLNHKTFLISQDILYFLNDNKSMSKDEFINFLNEKKIPYEVKNIIKTCNINFDFDIILSKENFKKIIFYKSENIQNYFLKLDNLYNNYKNYIYEYKIKILKKKLNKKDIKLKKKKNKIILLKKKLKTQNLLLKNININAIEIEWIYIYTSDSFQNKNLYKIDYIKKLDNLMIQEFKKEKTFYIIKLFKCYNSFKVLEKIKFYLNLFNYNYNYENNDEYIEININFLIKLIEVFIESINLSCKQVFYILNKTVTNKKEKRIFMPLDLNQYLTE